MTHTEALKLALEALEAHADIGIKSDKAITAIKEALAQPEQRNLTEQEHDVLVNSIKASSTVVSKGFLAQPQQEPVAWQKIECPICGDMAIATDIPPPQRTWVGLTIEDKKEYVAQDFGGCRFDAMDWAEKRLKEKNT